MVNILLIGFDHGKQLVFLLGVMEFVRKTAEELDGLLRLLYFDSSLLVALTHDLLETIEHLLDDTVFAAK
jgi:hypothetical protein